MTYSRLTKLFAYDWKVAKSPVGRETAPRFDHGCGDHRDKQIE